MRPSAVFLWHRLDMPGHDSCALIKLTRGWRLSGVAAFREGRRICQVHYEVTADEGFRTQSARVSGFVGRKAIALRIRARRGGRWEVDGVADEKLTGCLDVDLGFTPASNLLPLRRLALRVGQEAQAPAVYLDFPAMRVVVLPQRYRRLTRTDYDYESPTAGYRGVLRVSPHGAVVSYPGLFELAAGG